MCIRDSNKTFPCELIKQFRIFSFRISISISPGGGNTMPKPLSVSIVVVTKKKINSKKAISAMDDVGISPPLNLLFFFTGKSSSF